MSIEGSNGPYETGFAVSSVERFTSVLKDRQSRSRLLFSAALGGLLAFSVHDSSSQGSNWPTHMSAFGVDQVNLDDEEPAPNNDLDVPKGEKLPAPSEPQPKRITSAAVEPPNKSSSPRGESNADALTAEKGRRAGKQIAVPKQKSTQQELEAAAKQAQALKVELGEFDSVQSEVKEVLELLKEYEDQLSEKDKEILRAAEAAFLRLQHAQDTLQVLFASIYLPLQENTRALTARYQQEMQVQTALRDFCVHIEALEQSPSLPFAVIGFTSAFKNHQVRHEEYLQLLRTQLTLGIVIEEISYLKFSVVVKVIEETSLPPTPIKRVLKYVRDQSIQESDNPDSLKRSLVRIHEDMNSSQDISDILDSLEYRLSAHVGPLKTIEFEPIYSLGVELETALNQLKVARAESRAFSPESTFAPWDFPAEVEDSAAHLAGEKYAKEYAVHQALQNLGKVLYALSERGIHLSGLTGKRKDDFDRYQKAHRNYLDDLEDAFVLHLVLLNVQE